jgi:hypothetical protein
MAINKLSIDDLLTDNVLGAPPSGDTPNDKPKDHQLPDHHCTPDPTKMKADRQVVAVENMEGKHMAKQLECTTSIESTQKYGIHGFDFGSHTIFIMLKCLAS